MSYLEKLLQGQAVEWVTLGEVAEIYGGLSGKSKNDFEKGNAFYVTYKHIFDNLEISNKHLFGKVFIGENEKQHQIEYGDILFTGSSETALDAGFSSAVTVQFDEPVYLNSFCFGIRFRQNILIPEFSKHLFRSNLLREQIRKTASGVTRFNISKKRFAKIKIPLPPLTVQQRIAQILDTMTALTAELTAEHTLRQKQYQYYREKLLTFADETSGGGYKWVTLGEVCDLKRGKRLVKSELEIQGLYPVYQNSLTPLGYYDDFNCRADTTFIITAGAAGEIGYSNTDFWAADDCYMVNCPENLDSRFVYHALMTQKNIIAGQVRKASVPRLGKQSIEKLKIPLPPLATQQNIVAVLDTFDTLTQSISQGLPHAIALHQKRYEYYRGALLNFNE